MTDPRIEAIRGRLDAYENRYDLRPWQAQERVSIDFQSHAPADISWLCNALEESEEMAAQLAEALNDFMRYSGYAFVSDGGTQPHRGYDFHLLREAWFRSKAALDAWSSRRGGDNVSPKRIQRKRTKGWRMPEGAVYVGRPTKWGNPYSTHVYGEIAADLYETELRGCIESPWDEPHPLEFRVIAESLDQLRGKDLVCWCSPCAPCHADVLLAFANAPEWPAARRGGGESNG